MKHITILFLTFILFAGVTLLLPHMGQAAINTFDEVRKLDQAASRGIISNAPCTGVDVNSANEPIGLTCQLCHLVQLIDKLIYWMILFSLGAATFLFIYGGYHIMFFAASEHLYEEGKNIIRGTVIGLVIVLTAWLLINTLFKVMNYKPAGTLPWDKVECAGNPLSQLPSQQEQIQNEIRLSQQNINSLGKEKTDLTSDVTALRNRTRQTLTTLINEIDAQIVAIKKSQMTEADTFKISLLESKKAGYIKERDALPK